MCVLMRHTGSFSYDAFWGNRKQEVEAKTTFLLWILMKLR